MERLKLELTTDQQEQDSDCLLENDLGQKLAFYQDLLLKNYQVLNNCHLDDLVNQSTFLTDRPEVFAEIRLNIVDGKPLRQSSLELGHEQRYLSGWTRRSPINFLRCLVEIKTEETELSSPTVKKLDDLFESTRQAALVKNRQNKNLNQTHLDLLKSVQGWVDGLSLSDSSGEVGRYRGWLARQRQVYPKLFWQAVEIVVDSKLEHGLDDEVRRATIAKEIDRLKNQTIAKSTLEKQRAANAGQVHLAGRNLKISQALKGRNRSEATKQKIRQTLKGRDQSKAYLEAIRRRKQATNQKIVQAIEMVIIDGLTRNQASKMLGFYDHWLSQRKYRDPDNFQLCQEKAEQKKRQIELMSDPVLITAMRLHTIECLSSGQIGRQLGKPPTWFAKKMIDRPELINDCFNIVLNDDGIDEETKVFLREVFKRGNLHYFRAIEAYAINYNLAKSSQLFSNSRYLLNNFRSQHPDLFYSYLNQALKQQAVPQQTRLQLIKISKRRHLSYYKAIEKYINSDKADSLETISLEMGYHSGWLSAWKQQNLDTFDQYTKQLLSEKRKLMPTS